MEPLSDFDFYLKFAKPLILNLPKINDRTLAAAWVRKLVDEQSDEIKLDYIKLLLFVLQRQKLVQPFDKHPNEIETLEAFPKEHDLVKVAQAILEKDRAEKLKQKKECQSGDYPPYICDFSANLLEYTAVQNIENFGIHGYYAISKLPLPQWYRVDTKVLPKAAKSMIEVSPQPATVTGTLSSPQLRDTSPEKPRSPPEVSFAPSPPVEKPPDEEEPVVNLDETLEPPPPPPKPETPEAFVLPKKKPKPPQSPARLLGKPPEKDDREPPSWGSNLLEIKGFVQDEYTKDDLDIIWTSAASLPYQTPPRPGAQSDLWTSAASLPYQTPPRPPSAPGTPQMAAPFAASTPAMDFDDDGDLWASGMGSSFEGSSAFEDSPPSFLETSEAAEDATPIKPEAYSLPYATPRIPGVTPPPPGKPTPPPKRALRAPSKSKVAKAKAAIPAGAVQLEVEAKPQAAGPSRLRRFAPQKKGKKAAAAKAPTPPTSEYDLDEMAKLGLTEEDLKDINLDDIDIDLADISDPSSLADDYQSDSGREDSLDKQIDEFSKMITELEASYADNIEQLGGDPVSLTTAPIAAGSPARSPAARRSSRSPSPALARAKSATPPIPAAHDSPVRLDQSVHISPEAKRILGEGADAAVQLQVVQAPPKRRGLQPPKKVSARTRAASPQPSTSAAAIAAERAEAEAAAAAPPRKSRLAPPGSTAAKRPPSTAAAAIGAENALTSGVGASKAGSSVIPPKSRLLQPKRSGLKPPSSLKKGKAAPAASKKKQPDEKRESEYDLKELEELGLSEADLADINLDDIDIDLENIDLSDDDDEPPPSDEEEKSDVDKSIDHQIDEYSKMIAELEEDYAKDVEAFGDMVLSPGSRAVMAEADAAAVEAALPTTSYSPDRSTSSPTAALMRVKGQTPPIPQEHDAGVGLDQLIHVSPEAREILSESVKAKTPPKAPPKRQLPRRSGLPQRRTREEIYKELVSESKEAEEPKPAKAKKAKSKLGSLVKTFNKLGETSMKMGEQVSDQRDAQDMAEIQLRKDLAVAGVDPLGPVQHLQVGDDDGAVAGPSSAVTPRRIPQRGFATPKSERYISPPKSPRTKALERRAQEIDPKREAAALQQISERMPGGPPRSPSWFTRVADTTDQSFADDGGDEDWVPATDFFNQAPKYSPKKSPDRRMVYHEDVLPPVEDVLPSAEDILPPVEELLPPVLSPSPKQQQQFVEEEIIDYDELGLIPEDLITEAMSPAQDVKEYMEIIAFTEAFAKESPAMSNVPITTPKHTPSPKRPRNTAALLDFSPPEFADILSPGDGSPSKSPRATSPERLPSPFLTPRRSESPGGYTPRAASPRAASPQRLPSPFLSSPGGYTPKARSPRSASPPQLDPFDENAVPFEDMFMYGDEIADTSPLEIDEDELPDDENPADAFTWEYDSPGIKYEEQKSVEHTFADKEEEISPRRLFWRDRADEIKSKLFGTPEQQTPTVFDLPADRMLGETPPEFAPAEYAETPPIDAEALKAELRAAEMVPYKRPAGARIRMPRRKQGTTKLSEIEEKVEGLEEDEYNRIMKARGIKQRRQMRLKIGARTHSVDRHSKAPKLGMIEEFHDIEYPPESQYDDIFSIPFQPVDATLMGIDLPDELVPQAISPLLSPEIDRKELYKDILRQKKVPYKFPYRERVSAKHYVDRRSLPPQEMSIAEFPEYMSEEDQQFVKDVENAQYIYGSRQMVEGQRAPRLQPVYEAIDYPETPKGHGSPLPKVRARRKKVPRERLRTRRIDFEAADEYAQDAAAAAGYPNALLLEAMSAVEAEQKAKTPARPPRPSGLRRPGGGSGLQQPTAGASGLRPPSSGQPQASGLQRPTTSGLQRPSAGLRPPSSGQPRKIAVKKKLDKKCVDYAAAGSSNEERVQSENLEVYIEDSPDGVYGSSGRRRIFNDAFANLALVATPPRDGPPRTPALRILDEEEMPEGYYSPEFTPPTPYSRPEALQAFAQDIRAHEVTKKGRHPHPKFKQFYATRKDKPYLGDVDEVPVEERAAEIHDELEEEFEEEERRKQSLLDTSVPGGLKTPITPETEAAYKTPPHLKREVVIQPRRPTPTNPELRMQPTADRDILTFTDFEFPEEAESPKSPPIATAYDYFDTRNERTPEFDQIAAKYADEESEGNLFDDEEMPDYVSPTVASPRKFEDIQQDYGDDGYGLDSEAMDFPVSPVSPAAAQLVATKAPSPRRAPSPRAPSPRAPSPARPSTSRAPSPRRIPSPQRAPAASSVAVETPKAPPPKRPARRLMAPGTMAKGRGLKAPAAGKKAAAAAPAAQPKTPQRPALPSPSRPPTPPAISSDLYDLKDEDMDLFEDDFDDDDIEFEYKERVIDSSELPAQPPAEGGTELDVNSLQQLGLTSELVHGILQAEERLNQRLIESPDHSSQMYETLGQTSSKMQREPIYLKSKKPVERGLRHRHPRLGPITESNENATQYADDWQSLKDKSPRTRATYFAPEIQVSPGQQGGYEEAEAEWEYKAPPSPPRAGQVYSYLEQPDSQLSQDASMLFSPQEKIKSPLAFMYGSASAYGADEDLFGDANVDAIDRPPTPKTPEIFKGRNQLPFSPPTPPEEYVDVFENLPQISIDIFGGDVPEDMYPEPVAPGVTSPTLLAADLAAHERYQAQYGPSPAGYISPRVPVRRSQAPRVGQLPEYLEPKPQPRTPSPRSMKKMVQHHEMGPYKKRRAQKFAPTLGQQVEEVMTPPNVNRMFGYNAEDETLDESPPMYFSPPTPEGVNVGVDDLELCSPPFGGSPAVSPVRVPSPEAQSWWQQKVASPPPVVRPVQLSAAPLHQAIGDVPFAATLDDYDYGGSPPSPFLQPQTPPPRPVYGPSPAPSPYYQAQTPSPRRAYGPSPAPSPYYQEQSHTPPPRRAASPAQAQAKTPSPQRRAAAAAASPRTQQSVSPSNLAEFKKAVDGLKTLLDDFKTPSPTKFVQETVGSPPQYISPSSPIIDDIIDVDSATCLVVEKPKTPEGFNNDEEYDDDSPIPNLDYSGDDKMDFKWLD